MASSAAASLFPNQPNRATNEVIIVNSDNDDDDSDCEMLGRKPAAIKSSNRSFSFATAGSNTLKSRSHHLANHLKLSVESADRAMAMLLQHQEDRRAAEMKEVNSKEEKKAMATSPYGKSVLAVQDVIVLVECAKQKYPFLKNYNTEAVAHDDMVYFAKRTLELQADFIEKKVPSYIDIGYHYTDANNIPNIRTNGLLTKGEREQHHLHSRHKGSVFGDGVYTANDAVTFSPYGAVGLLVGRLQGKTVRCPRYLSSRHSPGDANTIIGDKMKAEFNVPVGADGWPTLDKFHEIVLRSSSQCLPMIKYDSTLLKHTRGIESITHLEMSLQKILDNLFNNGGVRFGGVHNAPLLTKAPTSTPTKIHSHLSTYVPTAPQTTTLPIVFAVSNPFSSAVPAFGSVTGAAFGGAPPAFASSNLFRPPATQPPANPPAAATTSNPFHFGATGTVHFSHATIINTNTNVNPPTQVGAGAVKLPSAHHSARKTKAHKRVARSLKNSSSSAHYLSSPPPTARHVAPTLPNSAHATMPVPLQSPVGAVAFMPAQVSMAVPMLAPVGVASMPPNQGAAAFMLPKPTVHVTRKPASTNEYLRYTAPTTLLSRIPPDALVAPKPSHDLSEECIICLESLSSLPCVSLKTCNHVFHTGCIHQALKAKPHCPVCRKAVGAPQGKSPSGSMSVTVTPTRCSGFHGDSIVITYNIPQSVQYDYHANPRQIQFGKHAVAFLPNNTDGCNLLKRLKFAFVHGLTFTVGQSMTTGHLNQCTWASIHHKTSPLGGVQAHGFPDHGYFENTNEELDSLGIPPADLLDDSGSEKSS